MKKQITGILLFINSVLLWGQVPVAVPLDLNPAMSDRPVHAQMKRLAVGDTISLPFIDDFSYYFDSPYPDPSLWMDRFVFINNDFPNQPRSNGVATFDALDAKGQIYGKKDAWFYADTLTSRPIDLGEPGMANIYLSFYYQPQGYGDSPEKGDSLILQFKSPSTKQWRNAWSVPGTTLHPFKQVMIPVASGYLQKGFQFRFVNIVSLEQNRFNPGKKSNVDQWNIDYVRLDKDRFESDTTMVDVAMIAPIRSLIKGYQAIPWEQFRVARVSRLEPQISITYRNNDNRGYLVTRMFEVTDLYHNETTPIGNGGAENIREGQIITYNEEALNPFESPSRDSAMFELKGFLKTSDFDRKENDTVRFTQVFKNFFARDDGIPESGYGYRDNNAGGLSIACRYETFIQDTLRAVQLYFNPVADSVTSKYVFKIAVWKDDNGRPGQQVYLSSQEYSPEVTGRFVRYMLDKPVNITEFYWVGWQQVTSGFLNVGFDLNYNDKGNLWYNGSGSWQQDVNTGTLMIRPMVGRRSDFPTSSSPDYEKREDKHVTIYPNPASQYIYIQLEDIQAITHPSDYMVEIFNYTGQLRYRKVFNGESIDVGNLEQGLYVLRLVHKKTGRIRTQKVMISRF